MIYRVPESGPRDSLRGLTGFWSHFGVHGQYFIRWEQLSELVADYQSAAQEITRRRDDEAYNSLHQDTDRGTATPLTWH